MSTQSEQINELAKALANAQGEMTGALTDSVNPFFKSKYANLESVCKAIARPFAQNGLSYTQLLVDGEKYPTLVTMLMHTSGQWLKSTIAIKTPDDKPQTLGSAISYYRRYSLQSISGVYQADDDGETAQQRVTQAPRAEQTKPVQAKPAQTAVADSRIPTHLQKKPHNYAPGANNE